MVISGEGLICMYVLMWMMACGDVIETFVSINILNLVCIIISVSFFLFQSWTNERVESEMQLIDSAVKSLRSLAKESRER